MYFSKLIHKMIFNVTKYLQRHKCALCWWLHEIICFHMISFLQGKLCKCHLKLHYVSYKITMLLESFGNSVLVWQWLQLVISVSQRNIQQELTGGCISLVTAKIWKVWSTARLPACQSNKIELPKNSIEMKSCQDFH